MRKVHKEKDSKKRELQYECVKKVRSKTDKIISQLKSQPVVTLRSAHTLNPFTTQALIFGKMYGQSQHLNVVPSVTMLGAMKARLVGATRGHPLLKKKSDALTMQFRQILKKIVSTKESMGEVMKTSLFALTEAKNVAGENIKHIVLENVQNASLKVRSKQENIAGVKLPKFEYFTKGETKNDLTGLARGGQQVQICRAAYVKTIEVLVELASLQTSLSFFRQTSTCI